jgi:parvulin-like peptidyl-prolyl isomerase
MKWWSHFVWIGLAASASAQTSTPPVGKIGAVEIHATEFRSSLSSLSDVESAALAKDPEMLKQVLKTLLVQKLVLQEALAKKWDEDPKIKSKLERLRESTLTDSYLQSISEPPPSYPSEAEITAAYETNKASLVVPKQFRLAQIYINLPEGADAAAITKAEAKVEAVKKALKAKGADFPSLARQFSEESQSSANDGEIGWVAESQIQPEIRQQLPKLELNVVSAPLKLADGWHFLKVMDIKEANTPVLAQVRPQLIQQLRAAKTRENSQAHLAKLLEENPLAINEVSLSEALTPTPKVAR